MNSLAQRLYWSMPATLRDLAAGVRGARLTRQRYGPETDRLMADALEREHWTEERWKAWCQVRLSALLERAATQVPFYRERWAARRRAGGGRTGDVKRCARKSLHWRAPAACAPRPRRPRAHPGQAKPSA